jgi:hypothetical protein
MKAPSRQKNQIIIVTWTLPIVCRHYYFVDIDVCKIYMISIFTNIFYKKTKPIQNSNAVWVITQLVSILGGGMGDSLIFLRIYHFSESGGQFYVEEEG